jgi:hypothetical protein
VRRENERRKGLGEISVSAELTASELCMKQKTDLMLNAASRGRPRLVVGYFPLIDELNHVYADQLESVPDGRAAKLFAGCAVLVDRLLGRLMQTADESTLLVVSSDHGAAAFQGLLHVNELFVKEGLVRRSGDGYDLRRSTAFYHTSDCGQVLARDGVDKPAVLSTIRKALQRASAEHGVEIGMLEGVAGDPYLAFLYPLGNGYFTGDPPKRGRPVMEAGKRGGHHLSPLSPTPWIQAVLGLWSPRSRLLWKEISVPSANREMKGFLLDLMGAR